MARPRGWPSKQASASSTPAKRSASSLTPLRQSKRNKSTSSTPMTDKATPRKSEYFESSSDLSEANDSETADDASNFGEEDASAVSTSESEATSDEYESEDGQRKRQRSSGGRTKFNGKSKQGSAQKDKKGGELWREGAKIDADPGTEVYIALPKARSAGSTPYRDNTLHPNTMLFLGDLKRHNDRAWLKAHDLDFRQSQRDFASLVDSITVKLMEVDTTLPELPSKDLVFRIYRDIRFSKDPTPYKTVFSAAWSRTGRKSQYAQYYLQIGPNQCFAGGGKWMPEQEVLQQMREDVQNRPKRIRSALHHESVRKHFLGGTKMTEDQAVKAFRKHNGDNVFKRTPKGWTDEGPNGSLVYLRNWTLGRKLADEEVMGPKGFDRIVELLGAMEPYITYMNRVLLPDPDESSSEDSDDDDAPLSDATGNGSSSASALTED